MLIGDYIHYRYFNYRKYGLGYNSPKNNEAPGTVFKQQKEALKANYPQKKNGANIELENTLNIFFGFQNGKIANREWTEQELKQIQQTVINIFLQSINQTNLKYINWNDLNAYVEKSLSQIVQAAQNPNSQDYKNIQRTRQKIGVNKKNNSNKSYTSWKAIEFRIKEINKLRSQIGQQPKNMREETFIRECQKLDQQYKLLKKETGDRLYIDKSNESFIQTLNRVTEYFKLQTSQNMVGILGEEIPKITSALINYIIANNVTNLTSGLNNFTYNKQTPERSYKQLDKSRVIGGTNQEYLKKSFNDSELTMSYTENKIDANFTLTDGSNIPASIKNYHIESENFKVLQGTSLLKYIQTYPEFVNHYLNVTSKPNGSLAPTGALLKSAHEVLKMTIALHALAGGVLGAQTKNANSEDLKAEEMAEVFIVNLHGSGKGKFKVYFIQDLLTNISKNLDLIKIDVAGVNLANPLWKNEWTGDNANNSTQAYKRIAKILQQIHETKFSVYIDKNTLT